MKLRVIREPSDHGGTLSVVYVDQRARFFGLEDPIREVAGQPVETWKVAGMTAIPQGTYPVRVTWSPKFQRNLPEIQQVPGFTGIRIHSGNTATDTSGCLLVGLTRAGMNFIQGSRPAVEQLQADIEAARARGEDVTITLENPA